MHRVLIANRGEIAVRIVRACRDAGLVSVAVYADSDRDAPHVRLADEAISLGGDTPRDTYLDIGKVLWAAAASEADAVHPGYGFLAESAEFATAVTEAGLTWIGPPPAAVLALGDKVRARRVALQVGAPLAAGTDAAVSDPAEIFAFADQHGLPIAIKAAAGGGGRGLKVARAREEIIEKYESAVREAVTAFGRGDCFVERYLERPRHVETQCLADLHGNVVVVSTRDCTLQRRHQKLVEEAPAPFLSDEQEATLRAASKAILRAAGYAGAGTCEFLVEPDGGISFLEVNTRLQVEHPVTEEVTGLDLVTEMFRIADGQELGYDDPACHGHAIEFRINAEDPARGFLPGTGTVTAFDPPSGPGVRVDAGVRAGTVIGPAWDSLLAKLIVSGTSREHALRRATRALAEFDVQGVPTVLPFHRAVAVHPAFAPERHGDSGPFTVHTRWIESEFDGSGLVQPAWAEAAAQAVAPRERVIIEVNGKRLEVTLPADAASAAARPGRPSRGRAQVPVQASADALTSPMQGTITKIAVRKGQSIATGDLVAVIEAMKMEQPITAHRSGTVTDLRVEVGSAVTPQAVICVIE